MKSLNYGHQWEKNSCTLHLNNIIIYLHLTFLTFQCVFLHPGKTKDNYFIYCRTYNSDKHLLALSCIITLSVTADYIYKGSLTAANTLCDRVLSVLTQHPCDGKDKWVDRRHEQRESGRLSQKPFIFKPHLFHFLSHSVFAVGIMGPVIRGDWDNGKVRPLPL